VCMCSCGCTCVCVCVRVCECVCVCVSNLPSNLTGVHVCLSICLFGRVGVCMSDDLFSSS